MRLVVLGNRQEEGVDYDETFAPVAKMTTIHIFLEVSVPKDLHVHHIYVHNTFLHGDLTEEVYMKLPQVFKNDDPTKFFWLRKSPYGLKQALRCWFQKLSTAFKKLLFPTITARLLNVQLRQQMYYPSCPGLCQRSNCLWKLLAFT